MNKPSYVARWVALCYEFQPEDYEICCNPIQYEMYKASSPQNVPIKLSMHNMNPHLCCKFNFVRQIHMN